MKYLTLKVSQGRDPYPTISDTLDIAESHWEQLLKYSRLGDFIYLYEIDEDGIGDRPIRKFVRNAW